MDHNFLDEWVEKTLLKVHVKLFIFVLFDSFFIENKGESLGAKSDVDLIGFHRFRPIVTIFIK